MHQHSRSLFVFVIVASVLSSSTVAPGTFGDLLVLSTYLVFVAYLALSDTVVLGGRRSAIILLSIVYLSYAASLVRVATTAGILSGFFTVTFVTFVAYIFINAVNVFVVPREVDFDSFVFVLNRVSVVIVLLGIPSIVVGSYSILWIDFDPYTYLIPFYWWGIDIHAATSFFSDSNAFSKVAFYGTLASMYEYDTRRTRVTAGLFALNLLGLFLGNSRGTMVAAVIGITIYVTYLRFGRRPVRLLTVVGGVCLAYVLAVRVGLVPGPSAFKTFSLSTRQYSWRAAVQTTLARPWFGVGPAQLPDKMAHFVFDEQLAGYGPQNSYLRLFVATGLVGGLAYFLFVFGTLLRSLYGITDRKSAILVAFGVALAFLQLFENFTLFGANKISVVAAVVFGYLVNDVRRP